MSNSQMYFWWGSGSGPCWKVMLVLAEKGLWEGLPNKLVSFGNKEHKSEEIMKLNPRGQVPTFKDGDLVVNESGAACMYIEEKYSNDSNRLFPSEPEARSAVYQKLFESNNFQTNVIIPLVYYKMRTKKEEWDEKLIAENTKKAKDELAFWNKGLEGKDFLCGSKFTMADVFLYPFLAFIVRLGATLKDFPNLKKYYDKVTALPTVQSTWPPHWKEGPGPGTMTDL